MAAEPEALPPQTNGEAEAPTLAGTLEQQIEQLQHRVRQAEERRRALLHIMGDLNESNRKLGDQRKAMLHILADYEKDRSRLAQSNIRLGDSRKAMIHIMGDLRETTQEMERREHELRDKQEQLVQAGKLATLGELETERVLADLEKAMDQVRKATEIISHLRTFGRAAPVTVEKVDVDDVIERALSLMHEQLRLHAIEVEFDLAAEELVVLGNPIQLEQIFINLLTNARDALEDAPRRRVRISSTREGEKIKIVVADTGPGIPEQIQQRIFDPFFTTKEVGGGTGLGLSITYSIVKEHGGEISLVRSPEGATFEVEFPVAVEEPVEESLL